MHGSTGGGWKRSLGYRASPRPYGDSLWKFCILTCAVLALHEPLLGPAGPQQDLALALIVSRVVAPGSKLSTLAW